MTYRIQFCHWNNFTDYTPYDADIISSMYRAAKDGVLFSYKILFIRKYLQYTVTGSNNGIKLYNNGLNGIRADLNMWYYYEISLKPNN